MGYVFTVTLPIYLGIALGFVAVRLGWIAAADVQVLGKFTIRIGVPALLFKSISHQSLGAVLHPDFLVLYAAASYANMAVVILLSMRILKRGFALAALQGLGTSVSNSMFVGYPIVVQVVGPIAGVALALCTLVENLLVMPLGLALSDVPANGERHIGRMLLGALKNTLKNPMILAIFAGLLVSASGVHVPDILDRFISTTASATSPVALFVIGGSLVGLQLSGLRADIGLIVVGKLVLHPLAVLALVLAFPPADPLLRAAAVLFAAAPMLSIYPVLAQRNGQGHERLCSAALLAATLASFFTMALAIYLLPAAWLPAR